MKVYETENLRNVAVVGHGDCGKTSLVSALLFKSGTINRLGKVEEKNTVTDYEDEEKDRGISIYSALSHLEWKNTKFNLIDTPGYAAFIFEAKVALRVVDATLVTVSGVSGVEVQTEKVWQWAQEYDIPRMVVMNLMDRDRAEYARTLGDIQDKLGREVVPLQLPLGSGGEFRGVIDLLNMKAYEYDVDGSGEVTEIDIPGALRDEAEEKRSELVEMIAEMDDGLMEKYFEAGELAQEELLSGLKKGILDKAIYPLFLSSATLNIGTDKILDAVLNYMPSPDKMGEIKALKAGSEDEVSLKPDADGQLAAYVYKTVSDAYAGKISLFRVYSGTMKADTTIYNAGAEGNERVGSIFLLQGREHFQVPEVKAGDLAATAKLKETGTGDTLCDKSNPVVLEKIEFPEPAISFALEPKSRGDEEKLSSALARVAEADPMIKVHRDPQTNELLLSGTGQLHVEVIVDRLKRTHELEVLLHPPKVPYKETIKKKAESHYRHKKQTGGKGQFAEVDIRLEPLSRGKDFEFVDKIFGGAIPQQFIPAVEKGISEARKKGFLSGNPVVDFRVTLYDGSFHSVDSSEMAFKIAASKAFKQAMNQADATILEPVMNVEISVPEDDMGDVMGDLNGRRGKVQGMDSSGSMQIIRAQVPLVEVLTYASTLKSITGGRGTYSMEFSHYDEVPAHIREKIIEESKKEEEEED